MQIQVSSVDNGYLVASPRELTDSEKKRMNAVEMSQAATQPQVHYCSDYNEVCQYIKRFFVDKIS